jgi:hypothetical protein
VTYRVLPYKSLKGESSTIGKCIPTKESLSSLNLLQINPVWDGMKLFSEFLKNNIIPTVVSQYRINVSSHG